MAETRLMRGSVHESPVRRKPVAPTKDDPPLSCSGTFESIRLGLNWGRKRIHKRISMELELAEALGHL